MKEKMDISIILAALAKSTLKVVVQEVAPKAFAKSAITSAAPNLAREQFTITNA